MILKHPLLSSDERLSIVFANLAKGALKASMKIDWATQTEYLSTFIDKK